MGNPPPPPRRPKPPAEQPDYTLYRARPRMLDRLRGRDDPAPLRDRAKLGELRRDRFSRSPTKVPGRAGRRPSVGRVVRWIVVWAVSWTVLSLLVFLVSAQLESGKIGGEVEAALNSGGIPPLSATTVLVLGSDQRTKGTAEPGATVNGPSRSDTILLMRVGGGHSARLAIPRDTLVDIPGHGRNKINAAYAIGGPALAIKTVRSYLGVKVNHVVEVNFDNFPRLIDAMGGITYEGGCVVSRINGGFRNGGFTLRLHAGKTHINGKQALALARTRHNLCNSREDDRTRARRQQKIFAAMKHRLLSPFAFIRLPLISWNAPRAIRSDMAGPTLLGLFGGFATSGSPAPQVLRPYQNINVPGIGDASLVSDDERRTEVRRFLSR
jgi:LCP family protein required for cell wall assembly